MPRIPRRAFSAHRFFHVTARGVNRACVFHDRDDFKACERRLRRVSRRHAWVVHAYCPMPNHVHLVVEVSAIESLSRGMQAWLGPYAQQFNARHGRWGHLWGDRYHARPIESEQHLGAAIDYVLGNPDRAGLHAATEPRLRRRRRLRGRLRALPGSRIRTRAGPRPREPDTGAATLAHCASEPHRTLRGAGRERPASGRGPASFS